MNTQILMVLDVLAKSLGVLLFAAALQMLWRKASAAQHCLVWLGAFTVLLLLPLTGIMKPVWTVQVPDRTTPPLVLHELPVIQSVPMISEDNVAPLPPVAEPSWQMPQLNLWQWLGLVWLTGVSILLLRRVAGAWQLRRLYRESFACETPRISDLASRLASELGVHRRVDLRLSSKVTVPLTWGFFKPVLLLPADAAEWQEIPLHAALCHELGHIRHWDALSRLLMSVLCALQWPNALLWLAAKSWRTAQEQACDDLVLNSGASKEAYAMQLLESARSVQRLGFLHAALTMAQPSTLETRLSAIMDLKRDRRPMRRGALLAGFAFAFSLLLFCAALQLGAEGKPENSTSGDHAIPEGIGTETRWIDVDSDAKLPPEFTELMRTRSSRILNADEVDRLWKALSQVAGVHLTSGIGGGSVSGHEMRESMAHDEVVSGWDKPVFIGWKFSMTPFVTADAITLKASVQIGDMKNTLNGKPAPRERSGEVDTTLRGGQTVLFFGSPGMDNGQPNRLVFLITVRQSFSGGGFPDGPTISGTRDGVQFSGTCDDVQYSDATRKIGKATGHVTLYVRSEEKTMEPLESHADSVEFDDVKKQAVLHGHPEIMLGNHRHFGTADDTKMIIHWDGAKIHFDTYGPAHTDILPGAQAKVKPLKNAAGAESPFKNLDIIGKVTNFDSVSGIATAKGHVEFRFTTNGNPPVIYRCKADALEYDSNKHEVALHGHVEIPDGATGGVVPSDHNDVVIQWNTKGSWEIRTPKNTETSQASQKTTAETSNGHEVFVTALTDKMQHLIFPTVQFKEATLEEAIEFLRVKSKDLDTAETRANFKGVNVMLVPGVAAPSNARLTLDLHDVPMVEALKYVTELANVKYKVESYAVIVGDEKQLANLGNPTHAAIRFQSPGGPDYFTIFGQVQRQGKYEIPPNQDFTISQAISLAGGGTKEAVLKRVRLVRKNAEGKNATTVVNVEDVIKNGNMVKDVLIHPRDVIIVEEGHDLGNFGDDPATPDSFPKVDRTGGSAAQMKADGIFIPTVVFHEATLDDALAFLRLKAKELDPEGKGVNLVLNVGPQSPARAARLTMDLKQIPLSEALRYVAGLANLEIKAEDNALILQQPGKKDAITIPAGTFEFKGGTTLTLDSGTLVLDHAPAPSPALAKAGQIIFPTVSFKEATVDEALDFLRVKSKELDPAREGVNIVLKAGPKAKAQDARLTMDLKNIPLSEVLHYVAELANLELIADDHAMVLRERSKNEPAAEQKGKAGAAAVPAKGSFTVFGQVNRQGKYELGPEEKLTLSQALLRAGGLIDHAKKVHVVRKTPDGRKTINVNYDNVMKGGKTEEDIQIEPDDVIIVDEKILNF